MNRMLKRLGALSLAAVLFAMSACTDADTSAKAQKEPAENAAMGRYIETERTLPEKTGCIKYLKQQPDGSLELFCNLDPQKNVGPWKIFTSSDGGQRWLQKDTPWLAQFDNSSIDTVTTDKDGNTYLYYMDLPPEIQTMLDEGITPPADFVPTYKFLKIDTAGAVTELDSNFPRGTRSAGVQSIRVADNGDYIVNDDGSLLQVDPATMKIKNECIPTGNNYRVPYIVYDSTLVMSDGDDIVFYDLTSGEKKNSLSFVDKGNQTFAMGVSSSAGGNERAFAIGADKALYIADRTGLYRHVEGGAVFEKLADGEMTSLNMPGLHFTDIVPADDGGLLVLYTTSDVTSASGISDKLLLHYAYSDSTPTVPGKDLKVYSLYDNKTIRQAMGLFQRQNPDVHVIYTVGMDGGTTVVSDALRTLSAELLAGKGPDLLVLDGMPLNSYLEKGVLLDLTTLADSKVAAGEWLTNVATSFKQADGKTFALPARFSVPMMLGDADAMAEATNLTSLADYYTDYMAKHADDGKHAMPGNDLSPYSLHARFYPLCAPAWNNADGSLKEDMFRSYLTDLKKLYDLAERSKDAETQSGMAAMNTVSFSSGGFYAAIGWAYGNYPAVLDELSSLSFLAMPDAAITKKGGGSIDFLSGQVKNSYLPKTVLGINANSTAQETALAFLELTLSEQVQKNNFEDGMPINRKAFDAALLSPYPDFDDGMTWGTGNSDGTEYYELTAKWPTDAFMQKIAAKLQTLDTPFMPDMVVQQMLLDETIDFFTGEKSLDDTVTAFTTKYNLYLAE